MLKSKFIEILTGKVDDTFVLGDKTEPGNLYECVHSPGTLDSYPQGLVTGDLVISLCHSNGEILLFNLRNTLVYTSGARDVSYKKREDISKISISFPFSFMSLR